jgi:hypothetical protein
MSVHNVHNAPPYMQIHGAVRPKSTEERNRPKQQNPDKARLRTFSFLAHLMHWMIFLKHPGRNNLLSPGLNVCAIAWNSSSTIM